MLHTLDTLLLFLTRARALILLAAGQQHAGLQLAQQHANHALDLQQQTFPNSIRHAN